MIIATKADRERVISILSDSFDQNNSVNYVINQNGNRKKHLRALMEYTFDVCFKYGTVYLTDDRDGCVCIVNPKEQKDTTLLDIKLALNSIGLTRIFKILKRESQIKKNHPKNDFVYLWFIGVNPEKQKNGLGTEMLAHVKNHAGNMPIYLETSIDTNVTWYKKHGFEIFETLNHGFDLYMMRTK